MNKAESGGQSRYCDKPPRPGCPSPCLWTVSERVGCGPAVLPRVPDSICVSAFLDPTPDYENVLTSRTRPSPRASSRREVAVRRPGAQPQNPLPAGRPPPSGAGHRHRAASHPLANPWPWASSATSSSNPSPTSNACAKAWKPTGGRACPQGWANLVADVPRYSGPFLLERFLIWMSDSHASAYPTTHAPSLKAVHSKRIV